MADFGITEFLAIASAATAATGALAAGQAQSASYAGQANALNYNAEIAKQNAAATYEQTNAAEDLQRRNTRLALGRQAAAIGQSGIDPTSGSSLLVAKDSATAGELDALTMRYKGDLTARGYSQQSVVDATEAQNATNNSKAARTSGYLGAAGSLLQAGSSYYSNSTRLDYLRRYGQTGYGMGG
jgi:murein L,D-transpeptidase YcbB/YkuD